MLSRGPIQPGTAGGITLKTVFGKVSGEVEFLKMFADGVPLAQAFRFVAMDEVSSKRLALAAQNMEDEGCSDQKSADPAKEKSAGLGKLLRSVREIAAGLVPGSNSKATSKK